MFSFSEINCEHPGSINNGDIHGTTYTYGVTVSYTCHGDYLFVDGSSSRTCQLSALWSGSKPRCACKFDCYVQEYISKKQILRFKEIELRVGHFRNKYTLETHHRFLFCQ